MFILQINNNQTCEWFEINDAVEILSCAHFSDLSECPKINLDANLVVLIPGEKVIMTSVKLPKMRASEKSQAILFALEEQLASDLDSVSIVVGDTQSDGSTIVAVYEKAFFEAQVNALQSANLFPRSLLPDFLALTLESETWSVVVQNKMAWVRTDFQYGFSVDPNNLFLLLQLQLGKNKNQQPKKIICWQQESVIDVAQLEKLDVPIEVRNESKFEFFDVKSLASKPAINFLQGKYRPKAQSSVLRTSWMWCCATAAFLILFLFLSQLGEWIYYRHQSNVLENQIAQVYQTLFPGSKDVLEPHFRTANLLKQFEKALRGSVFLKMMGAVGKTLLTFPDIQTTAIDFNNQQLTVTVNAKNVAQLSQWSQALHGQGFTVSQRVLSTGKETVQAEMSVKENKE